MIPQPLSSRAIASYQLTYDNLFLYSYFLLVKNISIFLTGPTLRSLQRDFVTAAADKAKRLARDSRTEDSTIGLFPHNSFWASTSVLDTLIKRSREAHRSCFRPVLLGKTSLTHTISSPPSRLVIPNVAFLTSEGFSPSVQPDSISGNEDSRLYFTLESRALGCEAAHSTFADTKYAASLFAIGAVLAFVSEALLAQVNSEHMVSCNVKEEEEGKSPEGRTNIVAVRIKGQLTSFLEDAPKLGVLLLDFSLPTRGADLVVHVERHSIERRERPGKIRVEIDPRPEPQGCRSGEVVVSGDKGFTHDYRRCQRESAQVFLQKRQDKVTSKVVYSCL
ncbi:hypothetical protein V6N11_030945 [Hibiscus sabdariffa]|uniref:Uncharacterized protein n=1 Tax=Hibiscus sabdariffa TaxID=183260 RepID=A0ABR2NRU8_9ROSI